MKISSKFSIFLGLALLIFVGTLDVVVGDTPTFNINVNDPNFDPNEALAQLEAMAHQQQAEMKAKGEGAKDSAAKLAGMINKAAKEHEDAKGAGATDPKDATIDDTLPDEELPLDAKEEDGVLVLTKDNMDRALVKFSKILLVEFYAPWCGHCKSLAPEYAKAAKELKGNDPPVPLAKVDATAEPELGTRFGVSGYPTLKFFIDSKPYDYDGPREAQGIIDYMKTRADPKWEPPKSHVVVLTQDNFTSFVNEKELTLVEFYAPWCGHCKQLEPEYEKASEYLLRNDPVIPLAKVDGTAETELAKQYGVSGYPTMKIFRKGKAYDYKGPRDQHGILDYMVKQVGSASKEVKTLKELTGFFPEDDVSVVGFFESDKDKEFDIYNTASNDLREDFKFVHTFQSGLRDHYKVNAGSVVVFNAERFYTKHENKWHVFEKPEAQPEDMKKFIEEHQLPMVGQYASVNNNQRYKKRPLCLVFYTVDFSFDYRKTTQMWRNKIADIAKDYRDITFAVADEEEQSGLFKDFKFDDSGEEMNIGCIDEKEKKYPMAPMDSFSSDDIREFLDDYKKGKITPIIKSQPVPKRQKGPVQVVVGKSFEKIVHDKSKDVLIEFYAPWCGHCKELEPIYNKLAKQVSKEKNLVIAKIDSTANDVPGMYEVSGFPTIFFSPANSKDKPIRFEGDRKLDDMKKFVEQHSTAAFGKSDKTKDEL